MKNIGFILLFHQDFYLILSQKRRQSFFTILNLILDQVYHLRK